MNNTEDQGQQAPTDMLSPMLGGDTFRGQTALITGGSGGIGYAIAHMLGQMGAQVAIIGRNQERLDEAVESLRAQGIVVRGFSTDVRDGEAVESAVQQIGRELGRISVLVNNAAGNFRVDPLELTRNGWKAVVDIVLTGTWNVTQTVGRAAIQAGLPLAVVNIGTSAATSGSPTTVHSASAKAGVLAMTKSLATAWAKYGIRLNMVVPGLTAGTGGVGALYGSPEELDRHLRGIPLGRLATKGEIANACAYLLSDYAVYITGTTLVVDGGRELGIH